MVVMLEAIDAQVRDRHEAGPSEVLKQAPIASKR
jgi:hypothetical protein